MIDGGLGQVHAAQDALREVLGWSPSCLIGLAKKEEIVVFPDGRELVLSRRNSGHKLLTLCVTKHTVFLGAITIGFVSVGLIMSTNRANDRVANPKKPKRLSEWLESAV